MSEVPALTLLIQATMAEKRLTLETVARRAGMPVSTVGAYHTGEISGVRARTATLDKLARGLGCPPELLYEAAGVAVPDERRMLALFRQLPSAGDRRQALATLRAHVAAARDRHRG